MQQLYRIIVKPYNYDHWDIFTEDKALFIQIRQFGDDDEAREFFGEEGWENITESYVDVKYPYVLLGETTLRQRD